MRGSWCDRKKPGAPLVTMVGHSWHYRGHVDRIDGNLRGLLLDVKTWADEGLIDAALAAGYYRDGGTPEMAWKALKDETGGKVDVWTYAWVPQTVADFDRGREPRDVAGRQARAILGSRLHRRPRQRRRVEGGDDEAGEGVKGPHEKDAENLWLTNH
jgi:hypothetical protein